MKLGFNWNPDKAKTFKPKRTHRVGTKRFELHKYAQATLGTGNLHEAVTLPEGEDANEWLAVNTVDFFNEINLLYGVIAEFCSEQACPIMCAGPKYEYMWADGKEIKKPVAVSAPRYVDYLMSWVQNQLDDEKIFPTQLGVPFPPDFVERVQNIFKRLFRVYARPSLGAASLLHGGHRAAPALPLPRARPPPRPSLAPPPILTPCPSP